MIECVEYNKLMGYISAVEVEKDTVEWGVNLSSDLIYKSGKMKGIVWCRL